MAQAIRLYAVEYDNALPPRESGAEAISYFARYPGKGGEGQWDPLKPGAEPMCHRARQANPYLRWPVILDAYLPSRDVWRCPSARLEGRASFINSQADWLGHLRAHEGEWGIHTNPWICPMPSWPAGWGGEVTDSLTQHRVAVGLEGKGRKASRGLFRQSIGVNEGSAASMNISEVEDPAWYVICADGGAMIENFTTGTLAYPDLCHLECAGPGDWEADWEQCPWSRECGATVALKTDPQLRRRYARHFGGVNIGFLDGHAQWLDSEEVIAESPTIAFPKRGRLKGYEPGAPTADAWNPQSRIPPLY